jgi:cation diffusion facilitator CzcD-associated flavoprotein CzcO
MSKHQDIIILGAGLSGIGTACHIKKNSPNKSFVILEARPSVGGTWDLFKYPGIRSDSDMFTLGYNFKPWNDPKVIADGPSILSYIKETANEFELNNNIEFNSQILTANWNSEQCLWTVTCKNSTTNQESVFTSNYLISCLGYYNYEHGFTPHFEGKDSFKGEIIHPQLWPENFDYSNKKVVIIGSGATAVTLAPAMANEAEKVTMLQRSPTYVVSLKNKSLFPAFVKKILPNKFYYTINRGVHISLSILQYQLSRWKPEMMKKFFIKNAQKQLPKDFDVAKHFTPKYNPWDERLCVVPNGDLFKAIRKGKMDVVTDHIEKFTENGILLKSGLELQADIIVTATGLDLKMFGGVKLTLDNLAPNISDAVIYKGMMIKDLPNFAFVVGYTNASWTLKADLVAQYFCKLINTAEKKGKRVFIPQSDKEIEKMPLMDFQSGYIKRATEAGILPQQGTEAPWNLKQNYIYDALNFKYSKLEDGNMKFY